MFAAAQWRQGFFCVGLVALALLGAASTAWPVPWLLPYGQPVWWAQLASAAGFYALLLRSQSPVTRFRVAAGYQTVLLASTFAWIYTSLHVYGGLAAWMSVLAWLALAAALSLFYGAAAYLHARYSSASASLQVLAFAAWWTAAELARGAWLTGFGWGAPGYAHTDGPLAVWAPYIGAYGVGALAVWLAATLASAMRLSRMHLACAVGIVLVSLPLSSVQWSRPHGSLSVTLLQGNIAQNEKFDANTGVAQALAWYANSISESPSALTVAPETAIPVLPNDLPANYWERLQAQFSKPGRALMVGIPLGNAAQGYTNSVLALSDQPVYRYDKHHLVPFGEYIPPMFVWFVRMMHIPLGDFSAGPLAQLPFVFSGQRLAANICYEDLFGEELGVRFRDRASAPTIFVNVSNLGWFGGGIVIDQHLQISRMRALEFERPFVRATNTGATVILDHTGRVQAALPRLTQGALHGEVQGREGTTPFAWWVARLGLWPYWLVIGLIVLVVWRAKSGPSGGSRSPAALQT